MELPGYFALLIAPVLLSLLSVFMHQATKTGSISRNSAIGLRTKSTMASDQAWKAGHAAADPYLIAVAIIGVVVIVTSVTLPLAVGSENGLYPPGIIAAPAIGLSIQITVLIIATIAANSAAKQQ